MNRVLTVIVFSLWAAIACSRGPHQPIQNLKPAAAPKSNVNYESVKPIFQQRCATCHNNKGPLPNWLDCTVAVSFAERGVFELRDVRRKDMPPQGTPEAKAMTDEEREKIGEWASKGDHNCKAESSPNQSTANAGPAPIANHWDKVESCANCHGDFGRARQPGIPNLAGQHKEYMLQQLESFKAGHRKDQVLGLMPTIAQSLSNEEKEFTASYFNHLNPMVDWQRPEGIDKDVVDRGRKIAEGVCINCHLSPQHQSLGATFPNIAGQDATYIKNQLNAFISGQRKSVIMEEIARPLSNSDIEALASYFSSLEPIKNLLP